MSGAEYIDETTEIGYPWYLYVLHPWSSCIIIASFEMLWQRHIFGQIVRFHNNLRHRPAHTMVYWCSRLPYAPAILKRLSLKCKIISSLVTDLGSGGYLENSFWLV